ncbi:hypothetical protein HK405_004804 [Cladochytrium tenue]|nr:hypothetical protein HK405_004804 [Cladochytrium tenue]
MNGRKNGLPFGSVLVLVLAGWASAVRADPCETGVVTSLEDAASLTQCTTLDSVRLQGSGPLEPGAAAPAPSELRELRLPNLEALTGALQVAGDARISAVTLPRLAHVGGDLVLADLPALAAVELPALAQVGGTAGVRLARLPLLRAMQFGTPTVDGRSGSTSGGGAGGLQGSVAGFELDNTGVESVAGLDFETAGAVAVTGNAALADIKMPALRQVEAGGLRVALNRDAAIEASALETVAGPVALAQVGRVELPALQHVALLDVSESPALESLAAPSLRAVDGDLALRSVPRLASLAFPSLETLGGSLLVANASVLPGLVTSASNSTATPPTSSANSSASATAAGPAFPALAHVGGSVALNLSAAATDAAAAVAFPSLSELRGALLISAAASQFDCAQLQPLRATAVLGDFSCAADGSSGGGVGGGGGAADGADVGGGAATAGAGGGGNGSTAATTTSSTSHSRVAGSGGGRAGAGSPTGSTAMGLAAMAVIFASLL